MNLKKIKKKSKKNSKTNIAITLLVLFVLFSMATGYAALSQQLDIIGSAAIVIPDYKIYISDVKVISTESGAYETSSPTFTDNEVVLYSTLPSSSSSMTYEITIRNVGNSDAIVDYLYTSSNSSLVQYKISGINATEIISRVTDIIVTVIVEPSINSGGASNIESALGLNFSFLKYNNTYSNDCTLSWDGSSSSQPVSSDINGSNYYQVTNANEFKWFIDQVNSGNTSINVMLNNDICLNNNAFTAIGTDNAYTGVFDGQNRSISGISFSRDGTLKDDTTYSVGLFMNNAGTIKNVNVTGNYSDTHIISTRKNTTNIGGIVVNNSGIIENASFNGAINLDATAHVNCTVRQAHTYNYIGGIASNNSGVVRGSYNNATFQLKGSTSKATCDIYTRSSNIYAGGIVSNNTGYVSDSYNKASITVTGYNETDTRTTNNANIGGIVSTNSNLTKNSYNLGTITKTISGDGTFNYLTDAIATNSGTITNVYLLSGSASNDDGTTTSNIVSASDLMNLNISIGKGFKKDLKNINNGYPILYWQ